MNKLAQACAMTSLSRWMRRQETFLVEIALAWCSSWLAIQAVRYPDRFDHVAALMMAAQFVPRTIWTVLAATSAASKVSGLILLRIAPNLSWFLRCLGLGMSAVIWGKLGISAYIADPGSIAAGPAGVLAMTACWLLLRSPTVSTR